MHVKTHLNILALNIPTSKHLALGTPQNDSILTKMGWCGLAAGVSGEILYKEVHSQFTKPLRTFLKS